MRFQRLNLLRFGSLTDVILDFPKSDHDLHVIYGPNEAGKSTVLAAIEGLFFGIPVRSPHNFLHENAALRVGAVLEHDGQSFEVFRRKGTRDTLLDVTGTALGIGNPAARLLAEIDEGSFRRIFSLDHDRLTQGGREILESQNEVGQVLFSASTGLIGLRNKLGLLLDEADGLWAPRHSAKRRYYAVADRLNEAEKQLREHQLLAEKWQAAKKVLEEADAAFEATARENEALVAEQRRNSRIRRISRTVAKLGALEQELIEVGPIVPFPEDVEAIYARESNNARRHASRIG